MVEKECWWREEPITADSKEQDRLGLKEDPITQDPKENPINGKAKEDPYHRETKDNAINEDSQELQDPQWLLSRKLTPFGFLVMVYDRVDDGDIYLSFFCFLILLISAIICKQRKLYKNDVTQSFWN